MISNVAEHSRGTDILRSKVAVIQPKRLREIDKERSGEGRNMKRK